MNLTPEQMKEVRKAEHRATISERINMFMCGWFGVCAFEQGIGLITTGEPIRLVLFVVFGVITTYMVRKHIMRVEVRFVDNEGKRVTTDEPPVTVEQRQKDSV